MKLSDIMSHAGLSSYAEVALLIFFGVFMAVVWRLFISSEQRAWDAAARLPLDDAQARTPAAREDRSA